MSRAFASDNNAEVHPAVLRAMEKANAGHAVAYGGDEWTARAERLARKEFGGDARLFLTLNGTGANVVSLAALLAPHEAAICAESAHLFTDECGAPERIGGIKLLTCPAPQGKLAPAGVAAELKGLGSEHHIQPRVVSITQSTELGTVYSRAELRELARFCRKHGLLLHVDGARLCNAAASLGASLRAACEGADAISFGLTKNGAMNAEAVVVFDPAIAKKLPFTRKQCGQLGSKLRFAAAQFCALLEDGLWRKNAEHANAMAKLLEANAREAGVDVVYPVQANAVFARLPRLAIERARKKFRFYDWDERENLVRWMCAWDTKKDDVLAFARALRAEKKKARGA